MGVILENSKEYYKSLHPKSTFFTYQYRYHEFQASLETALDIPSEVEQEVEAAFAGTLFQNKLVVLRGTLSYFGDANPVNKEKLFAGVMRKDSSEDPWVNHDIGYLHQYWFGECFQISSPKHLLPFRALFGATPEQWIKMYGEYRPDLLEEYPPFDPLMYLCCGVCERVGPKSHHPGHTVMMSPTQKQQSVRTWLRGTANQTWTLFPEVSHKTFRKPDTGKALRDLQEKL